MIDIVAPIFSVFIAGEFGMGYLQMLNNFAKVESEITDEILLWVEGDTYHCFSNFIVIMK